MSEVTYGRLDEVLRSWGFSVQVADGKARVYEHKATGALIFFPDVSLAKPALPRHLGLARMTLELYGITTPMEFAASLLKAS
jgi:hypothetical protein